MRNVNYVNADGSVVKTLAQADKNAKVILVAPSVEISDKAKELARKRTEKIRKNA